MLRYFLSIEVVQSKHGIFLSQRKYVFDLLSETGKLKVKPCISPLVPSVHLTKEDETFQDPERYRILVGKLNYLTVTCPDIVHSINVVSQYLSSPTVDHWAAVEQILCYLKEAPRRGIYTTIMGIIDLSVSQMLIGQDLRRTGGPLWGTLCLLKGI